MEIVPAHNLPSLLRLHSVDPEAQSLAVGERAERMTIQESQPPVWVKGPHRKAVHTGALTQGPFPVEDRPALSNFVARVFTELEVGAVLATVPPGAFWLNNKGLSLYLRNVAGARTVSTFLRSRGLTDRFQGGFLVRSSDFTRVVPVLAAGAFCGASNVLFTSLSLEITLTVLACQHFDLHVAGYQTALLDRIADLAQTAHLSVLRLAVPDSEGELAFAPIWSEDAGEQ